MVNNEIDLRRQLEQLPTPELAEMVQAETGKEIPDDELVLLILDILEARTADRPVELTPGQRAAWKRYQAKVRKRARPGIRWGRMVVAAAASLALILGMVFVAMPQEAKAGSIYDVIAYCTDGLLEFFGSGSDESMLLDYEFQTEHPGLQKLHDTVVEYGYDGPAVPMWIPEEYQKLSSLDIDATPRYINITAAFSEGNKELIVAFVIYNDMAPRGYAKDLPDPKNIEIYGENFCYVKNANKYTVVWEENNIEGFITLDCHEETLNKILKSIYVMEVT